MASRKGSLPEVPAGSLILVIWNNGQEDFRSCRPAQINLHSQLGGFGLSCAVGQKGMLRVRRYSTMILIFCSDFLCVFGLFPRIVTGVSNPNIKWETTTTYNAGIDFGFVNDRITGTVEA
ncbi:MAG: TonB-dependent receptor, partial [Desulfovibrio sp.]|nr:TonB-dependent receptor [Desulfovibrio sp.]